MLNCPEEERIYTENYHMLIFVQKKSGAGWIGGWVDGRAGLRIAYSNQQMYQLRTSYSKEMLQL